MILRSCQTETHCSMELFTEHRLSGPFNWTTIMASSLVFLPYTSFSSKSCTTGVTVFLKYLIMSYPSLKLFQTIPLFNSLASSGSSTNPETYTFYSPKRLRIPKLVIIRLDFLAPVHCLLSSGWNAFSPTFYLADSHSSSMT